MRKPSIVVTDRMDGPTELIRAHAEKVREPQPPHHHNRAENAALLPAPARRGHARAQTQRRRDALESSRKCDVLHKRNPRKAARRREGLRGDEYRLIAGCDAGQPRAQIHHERDHRQQRVFAFDRDVEAAPAMV
jgi:hypothetical protein